MGLALAAVVAGGVCWASACTRTAPPGDKEAPTRVSRPSVIPPIPSPSTVAAVDAGSTDAAPDVDRPYEGPLIGAAALTVPIYSEMEPSREKLVGYLRSGSKAPVIAKPIVNNGCKSGWYKLIPHGFVCSKFATVDLEDPRVRLGTTPPKLDQVVPYQYAYNTKDGTPLYRSVPSREQMLQYEPYLAAPKKKRAEEPDKDSDDPDNANSEDGGASARDSGEAEQEKLPWWQQAPDAGRPEIRLSDMTEGSDSILAKRMAKGFFVAVDKTFGWNKRLWYKTTGGLVAPSDRMALNKPPSFHGVEIGGPNQPKLPVGFIISPNAYKYDAGGDGKEPERKSKAPLHTIAALTGKTMQRKGALYRETTDGWWMRAADSTVTEPGPVPSDIGPNEKWIDVNLNRQTLVAFEGSRPVYATAISSGKKGETKSKDHSTVEGSFRIREKHITATMDGDGAAPGESPYSIDDVPYVMYFKGSYALHGSFWHNNYGHKMSHGCVNLAPLDAKHIFLWVGPTLHQGWHGVWSVKDDPGTLIVIHQ